MMWCLLRGRLFLCLMYWSGWPWRITENAELEQPENLYRHGLKAGFLLEEKINGKSASYRMLPILLSPIYAVLLSENVRNMNL